MSRWKRNTPSTATYRNQTTNGEHRRRKLMSKVLIVDDSPIVTKLIEATLITNGFVVEVSNTAFGVSQKIREFQPQVLLMDLGLPGLSGDALLGLIKNSGAKC